MKRVHNAHTNNKPNDIGRVANDRIMSVLLSP